MQICCVSCLWCTELRTDAPLAHAVAEKEFYAAQFIDDSHRDKKYG
jgi:hypothetical protein